VIQTLQRLNTKGKSITENDIIAWSNNLVKQSGKQTTIKNFRDPILKTGVYFLDILDSIRQGVVDYSAIQRGNSGTYIYINYNQGYCRGKTKDDIDVCWDFDGACNGSEMRISNKMICFININNNKKLITPNFRSVKCALLSRCQSNSTSLALIKTCTCQDTALSMDVPLSNESYS